VILYILKKKIYINIFNLRIILYIINQIITHLYRVVHANKHVTRLTRLVPLVEQELPTLPEHLSSPPPRCFVWLHVYNVYELCMLNDYAPNVQSINY
jgi:hypothetical protein